MMPVFTAQVRAPNERQARAWSKAGERRIQETFGGHPD